MAHSLETLTSSIVAVGKFNPAIFSPDWLEKNGLIGAADADDARNASSTVISHQASFFETAWFSLQVLEGQYSLTSKGALTPALRDLAVSIFQLVQHTPVEALGLNFIAHYKLPSLALCHKIGDTLAPKEIWNSLYPGEDRSAGLGNLVIRIQNGERDHPKNEDEIRLTVQPSTLVKGLGVAFLYNNHMKSPSENPNGLWVSDTVRAKWESAWSDATRVFEQVMSKCLENT